MSRRMRPQPVGSDAIHGRSFRFWRRRWRSTRARRRRSVTAKYDLANDVFLDEPDRITDDEITLVVARRRMDVEHAGIGIRLPLPHLLISARSRVPSLWRVASCARVHERRDRALRARKRVLVRRQLRGASPDVPDEPSGLPRVLRRHRVWVE